MVRVVGPGGWVAAKCGTCPGVAQPIQEIDRLIGDLQGITWMMTATAFNAKSANT